MLKGLNTEEIDNLLCEYENLCHAFDVDKRGWITFMDYLILRTGIGLEKEIKLYKIKKRIDYIDEDFKDDEATNS